MTNVSFLQKQILSSYLRVFSNSYPTTKSYLPSQQMIPWEPYVLHTLHSECKNSPLNLLKIRYKKYPFTYLVSNFLCQTRIENSLFIHVVLATRNVGNSEYIATLMLCIHWCYQKCWESVMCWGDFAAQGSSLHRCCSPSCIPPVIVTGAETGWRQILFSSICVPMANPNTFSKYLCSPTSLYSFIWDTWEAYALLYLPCKNQWTTAMPKLS